LSQIISIKHALSLAGKQLASSDSAALDCEVLLAHIFKKDRSYLRAWPEKTLSEQQYSQFYELIKKRQQGEPIAYLTACREFWSRPFIVSPDVLIPRPDTELLVDIVLQKLKPNKTYSILDMGTGSGAIAITLALELKQANVTAIDSSDKALNIAQQNAKQLHAPNIKFINSHWFDSIPAQQFDLIVSNPPYICNTDPHLTEGDVRFEPLSALISAQQGLHDIQTICASARPFLKNNGLLLFEHGYQQSEQVQNLLELARFNCVESFKDIQGHTRATLGQQLQSLKE